MKGIDVVVIHKILSRMYTNLHELILVLHGMGQG